MGIFLFVEPGGDKTTNCRRGLKRRNDPPKQKKQTKNQLRLLIHPNGAEVEISVGECARVVIDTVDTRAGAPVPGVGTPCPITTKGQVDDNIVGRKL